jgi:hypothetical protein
MNEHLLPGLISTGSDMHLPLECCVIMGECNYSYLSQIFAVGDMKQTSDRTLERVDQIIPPLTLNIKLGCC